MTDEEIREAVASSEAAIQMVMTLECCSREIAIELLRQSEIAAYQVAFGPGKDDTIH
jgi:hypothetical protein